MALIGIEHFLVALVFLALKSWLLYYCKIIVKNCPSISSMRLSFGTKRQLPCSSEPFAIFVP